MSNIHLCKDLSALQLAPADEENYGRAVLHSTVYLGPYAFHAWAIQVEQDEEDGILSAVEADFESDLEHVCGLMGTAPQTQEIDGRTYVLVIYPHGE